MGKYNKKSILAKVKKSPAFHKESLRRAQLNFNTHKKNLLKNFDRHEITQEINGGPDASNISGTLDGYGNLFSFIGFHTGTQPAIALRQFLDERTRLMPTARNVVRSHASRIVSKYRIVYPSFDDIASATPMPWEGGSWAINIERGISGFSSYLYQLSDRSRSGRGTQAKVRGSGMSNIQRVRGGSYRPAPYLSQIMHQFTVNFSHF